MRLNVMIAGQADLTSSFDVEPDASIASLLDEIECVLEEQAYPSEFTAYFARRCGRWQLRRHTSDYDGLVEGDALVTAAYYTPETWLDPEKTVGEIFSEAPTDDTIHIVLVWSPGAVIDLQREQAMTTHVVDFVANEMRAQMASYNENAGENDPQIVVEVEGSTIKVITKHPSHGQEEESKDGQDEMDQERTE